jgi:hypothetical protein
MNKHETQRIIFKITLFYIQKQSLDVVIAINSVYTEILTWREMPRDIIL